MTRIFVPLFTTTISHVVRPIQVARALRERGAEVIFGADDRYRPWVEKEGFECRRVYAADPALLLDAVRRLDLRAQIEHLPRYLESDLDTIASCGSVDAVLSDFRFTVRLAAEALGVPHVALINGYYSPYYDVVPEFPEVIAARWPPRLRTSVLLRRMLWRHVIPRWHGRPYRRLCREHGFQTRIGSVFDIAVSKTLTLIADLPEFTPQRDLPDSFRFVGPIAWEPDQEAEPIPDVFDGTRRPLIYVTLGTSGDHGVLDEMLRALVHEGYDVVASTGSGAVRRPDPHAFVAPFVRASALLPRACLMICHGGNGSVYQALQHAVPVLCVTTFFDQEWNGQRVRELGLGLSVPAWRLHAEELPRLADHLIRDERVRANLRRFRTLLAQWNAPALAADAILARLACR